MRFLLVTLIAVLALTAALKCFQGVVLGPRLQKLGSEPVHRQCPDGFEKCCKTHADVSGRVTFSCEKKCPDLKKTSQVVEKHGFEVTTFCMYAEKACKYNGTTKG